MKKLKVAVLDRFSLSANQRLKLCSSLEYVEDSSELEIAVIRTHTKIDADFLNRHPKLKLVVTATSGFDHIDIHEARARGVQVAFCPEGNVHSAAELTILLALALSRKLGNALAAIKKGSWNRDAMLGSELFEKTWGILGLGRIGRKVARLAKAFGAEVIAHDPFVEDFVFDELNVERVGLNEVFLGSDILSLHVPLTPKTKNIVNISTMDMMNPDLLLINTSRGGVIQESDLIEGLRQKKIAGCALDVYQQEPLNPKSVLLEFENVVLTPHIGGNTFEAFERSCHLAADKAIHFSDGKSVSKNIDGNPFDENWVKEYTS